MSASSSKTHYIYCGKFQDQSGSDEKGGKLTAEEKSWLDKLPIKILYETIEKRKGK